MLMPVLAGAQQASMQIVCASNLRTIGQGFSVYLSVNGGAYPPAYTYVGETTVNGVEEDIHANLGHVHWSSYLLGAGAVSSAVFHCPALDQGGITPTATTSDNLEPGQFNGSTDGQIDQQAPRLAYTVNEAICPRNKFYGYPN